MTKPDDDSTATMRRHGRTLGLTALGASVIIGSVYFVLDFWKRPPDFEGIARLTGEAGRIGPEGADLLFGLERIGNAFRYDPEAILLPLPDLEQRWTWPEHPDGAFVMRTNGLGFVEDEETEVTKHGLRVLVAGDSHTQGIVNAAETFPNVLEDLLNQDSEVPPVEVINAGCGYTGPRCYLARLEKYFYLRPDVFVAAVFTGNDFSDDVAVTTLLEGRLTPRPPPEYLARLDRARERFPGMVSQGLNQAHRFKRFPEEAELGLERVLGSMEAIQELCESNGIRLVAVVLPTKVDVDADCAEDYSEALEILGLTRAEGAVNRRLGIALTEALHERGIPCIDPVEAMRLDPGTPHYWKADHHLSVAGHALVARMLFDEVSWR